MLPRRHKQGLGLRQRVGAGMGTESVSSVVGCCPSHPGVSGLGSQGEARVSLTTLSMEVEATRVEPVATVTRA